GCGSSSSHVAYVTLPSVNGITGLRVNDDSGAITTIFGSPFPAGHSPSSVWIHPSNKFLYVVNQTDRNISLFTIESKTGPLTEVMPRVATGLTPTSLTGDPNGGFLYVANEGSDSISSYSIDAGSGVLTPVTGSPFSTPSHPFALTVSPSGSFLYVVNPNLASVF